MAAYTAIDDPSLYFTSKLYTSTYSSGGGTGATINVTLDATEDFAVDLVWIKGRSVGVDNHVIADRVRGANKNLHSNTTDAEATNTDEVTAFGDDGFTVGNNDTVNRDGASSPYVAWCWKESATSGFDIITWSGNGSNRTIAHSLSTAPKMIICKRRDADDTWWTYNETVGAGGQLYLNGTAAAGSDGGVLWNTTAPTSSVFSLGTNTGVNGSGGTYVAYAFADVQGFSKFGSYTGNGNADGTFVYTGFKPAFLIVKKTSGTDNWTMADNKRPGYNSSQDSLYPNLANAEVTTTNWVDFYSNGFKLLRTDGAENGSGATYVYMAFAEAPFVNSNGVPNNAR